MLIISIAINFTLLLLFLHKWYKNKILVNSLEELKVKLATVTHFAEHLLKNKSTLSQNNESNH